MNLRPPSVTVSTQTSAFKAVAFQSPAMPSARMSLWTQSVHSFSFPPRPLRTAPSRFPKKIRFGSRPPLIRRRSVPAHKSLLACNVVSMLSHPVISAKTAAKDTMNLDTAQFCFIGSGIGWVSTLLYYYIVRLAIKQITSTDCNAEVERKKRGKSQALRA